MSDMTEYTGKRIRMFRKSRHMTIQELADAICKSKATVSKYENGQIAIDIDSLYDIARTLGVTVPQLVYCESPAAETDALETPAFFRNTSTYYAYNYDGRKKSIKHCVIKIRERQAANCAVMMYMNIKSYEEYEVCENTYIGTMYHYDALTSLIMKNKDTPMETYTLHILSSYLDAPTKYALSTGISSRPLMPVSAKYLISKKPLADTKELRAALLITKEDIRILKQFNMLTFF